MVLLSLLWMALGVLIGLLACAAKPGSHQQVLWPPNAVIVVLIGGGIFALTGGWLGTLLIGRLFATTTAVWIGIVGIWLTLWRMKAVGWPSPLREPVAACPEEK